MADVDAAAVRRFIASLALSFPMALVPPRARGGPRGAPCCDRCGPVELVGAGFVVLTHVQTAAGRLWLCDPCLARDEGPGAT